MTVTPATVERLQRLVQAKEAVVLDVILADEVNHVVSGVKWFEFLTDREGLDAQTTWRSLVREHFHGQLEAPFNNDARQNAGFSPEHYK